MRALKKISSWLFLLLLSVSVINYPNPFNPFGGEIATFECSAEASGTATLYVYDLAARLVWQKTVNLTTGTTSFTWDGYNNFNQLSGNGLYLYRLVDGNAKSSLAKGKVWIVNR